MSAQPKKPDALRQLHEESVREVIDCARTEIRGPSRTRTLPADLLAHHSRPLRGPRPRFQPRSSRRNSGARGRRARGFRSAVRRI